VVACWRGYLSGARCKLAYCPADATATHCLLLQYFSKIQIGCPEQRAVKRVCVHVRVRVCMRVRVCVCVISLLDCVSVCVLLLENDSAGINIDRPLHDASSQ